MIINNDTLPNVFINNIEIYDNHIKYDIFITDQQTNPVWSNKKSLEHVLKLKHIVVFDKEKIDNISNGTIGFHQHDVGTKVETVSFMKKSKINGIINLNDQVCYIKTCSYKFTSEVENVAIFANLFIDGVSLEGAIVSEDVLVNSTLKTTTNILLKNKEQYYGPVHYHEGVYMEGKSHTETPHSALEVISALNLKIKDYRTKNYTLKRIHKNKAVPVFSNLLPSFDENTSHNYLFFINLEELLVSKTKFGYLYPRLSERAKQTILNNIELKTIRINRHSVKERTKQVFMTSNLLSGFESREGYKSTSGDKFKFVPHGLGANIRAVKFHDMALNCNSFGTYQYELEFSFNDNTVNFFKNYMRTASVAIKRLEYFRDLLLRPNMYDFNIRILKDRVLLDSYVLNNAPIGIVEFFNEIKIFLYSMTDPEIEADLIRNYNLLNPKSCTLESVEIFIKECKDLYNKLSSFYGVEGISVGRNYRDKSNVSSGLMTNRIFVSHKFKNIINPSNSKFHYVFAKEKITVENINEAVSSTPKEFGTVGNRQRFEPTSNPFMNKIIKDSFFRKTPTPSITVGSFKNSSEGKASKEAHENATEYLGKDSNFNSFSSEEKCETIKNEPIIADEIETKIITQTDNIQDTMSSFTTKMQVLVGFKTDKNNKLVITQPIWSDDSQLLTSRSIVKQETVGDVKQNMNYPFPNQHILLSDNSTIYKTTNPDLEMPENKYINLAKSMSVYGGIDPLFTQSKIITDSDTAPAQLTQEASPVVNTATNMTTATSMTATNTQTGGY